MNDAMGNPLCTTQTDVLVKAGTTTSATQTGFRSFQLATSAIDYVILIR